MKKHKHKFRSSKVLNFNFCKCGAIRVNKTITTINGHQARQSKYYKTDLDYLTDQKYYTKIEIL